MASSHHFAHRHQVSARLARVTKFQLVWHRLCDVVLFRSSCRFENTLTAVCALPEYQSCQYSLRSNICEHLNGLHIFDQTDLYRFEVRLELYGANARLVVSPPSLSQSHPPMPSRSRWPALTTLPPLTKFQLVWRRLLSSAVFLLPRWSETPVSAVSSRSEMSEILFRFALNMNIKLSIIFADTVHALTATFAV